MGLIHICQIAFIPAAPWSPFMSKPSRPGRGYLFLWEGVSISPRADHPRCTNHWNPKIGRGGVYQKSTCMYNEYR